MANLKELFPEFYQAKLDIADLSIDSDNVIVLDTNYLLDIIQLPTSVSKKYIEAIEKVKDNIYIPYLVALEFNFRKSTIKKEKRHKIRKYKDDIDNSIKNIKDSIDKIDLINVKEEKENFTKELFDLTDSYSESLRKLVDDKIQNSVSQEEEELYSRLITIIEGKIGEKYDQAWINGVESEGEQRYAKGIPPGFDDQTKQEEKDSIRYYGDLQYQRKYGDLIIWKDIVNFAKKREETGNKVIFVTNDGQSKKKRDLLYKVKDLVVGPNIYLMNELQIEAQKEFYILSNFRFLQLVNDLSDVQIKELKSISEPKYKVEIPNEEIPNFLERLNELNSINDKFMYHVNSEGNLYAKDTNRHSNDNDEYQRDFFWKQLIENNLKNHSSSINLSREMNEKEFIDSHSSDDYINNMSNREIFEPEKIVNNITPDTKRGKYRKKKDIKELILQQQYLQQLEDELKKNIQDFNFDHDL